MLSPALYNLSTHTFTSCGSTGATGPTLSNNYYGVTWSNQIISSGSKPGVQLWTAPLSTLYNFEVAGCAGIQNPASATGAIMRGDIFLQKGQQVQILVGQYGGQAFGTSGSGGTFIADISNTPLIVAGGGAGSVSTTGAANSNASASITTIARNSPDATGGSNARGGNSIAWPSSNAATGGGGGFLSNAQLSPFGGYAFVNGGQGGFGSNGSFAGGCDGRAQFGGFGGGGGVSSSCSAQGGGGGGYSGGAAGVNWIGGGGGSYSIALNQSNTELAQGNSNAGYVRVRLGTPITSNNPVSFDELRQRLGSNSGPISMSQVYGRFLGVSTSGNVGITDLLGKPPTFAVTPSKTSNAFVTSPVAGTWVNPFVTSNASWIWYTANASGGAAPNTIPIVFEKVVYQSNNANINANVYYAADNLVSILLNCSFVGSTMQFGGATTTSVTLLPGSNLFEFYVNNSGGSANPAGFIYSVVDTNSNVLAISDSNTLFSTTMSTDNMMYLGFDAGNTGVNTPDSTMTSWRNTGWVGPSYNATASNGPVLRYNQRWYVEFNRSNLSHFNIDTSIPQLLNTWGGFTVFVVGQMTNVGSFERFFDFGNGSLSNNIVVGRYGSTTNSFMEIWNGNTRVISQTDVLATLDSNWNIWAYATQVSSSNTSTTVYRNGTSVASAVISTPAIDRTTTINYLGRSLWDNAYLHGNISEYRFYSGFLNSNVVSEIYNNLRVKWNL